ncbi:hypothetical protein [Ascidiimonas aurantiaca]|uniref:hypothetical protein n=1 Tax=Ascidiimonas aurantiaca TaxID=1685432 RepID=UPI0030ED12BD
MKKDGFKLGRLRRQKVAGFTIHEMVVVVLLTSLVVGLAFSVLGLVRKQMGAIRQNFQNQEAVHKFEQRLWLDMHRCNYVYYDNGNNELKMTSAVLTITYTFGDQYVLRNADTLEMAITKKQLYFDGYPVENGLVDAIELTTARNFLGRDLFIFKDNDADIYMNGFQNR